MSEAPIGFDLPTPEPQEPQERKSYVGTAIASALIFFLILLQLFPYLDRGKDPNGGLSKYHTQLRTEVKTRALSDFIRNLGGSKALKDAAEQDSKRTKQAISELSAISANNPEAASIESVFRYEAGEKIPEKLLTSLAASKTKKYQEIAEIYGEKPLSSERIRKIEKDFTKEPYAYSRAIVHAKEKAGDKNARQEANPDSKMIWMAAGTILLPIILVLGIGALLLFVAMRASGVWKPRGHPLTPLTQVEGDLMALRGAQLLGATVVVEYLSALILRQFFVGPAVMIIGTLLSIGVVLFIANLPFSANRPSPLKLLIQKDELGKNILWGMGAAFANLPILFAVSLVSQAIFRGLPEPEHPATEILLRTPSFGIIAGVIVAASIGAPIMEELIFRGSLLPGITRVLGKPYLAAILVNLGFAAIHPTGIPAWPALAMLGISMSVVTNMRGSLVPAIVMHAVHNFLTTMFVLFVI